MPLGAAKAALLGAAGTTSEPAYEALSQVVVASEPTYQINFTSIPQTYQMLKIVIDSGNLTTYGNLTYTSVNSDTTTGNYFLYAMYANGATNTMNQAVVYTYGTLRFPYGDWPNSTSYTPPPKGTAIMDFYGYVRDGTTPRYPVYSSHADSPDSYDTGDSMISSVNAVGHDSTTSISDILITREAETWQYSWTIGTKFTLYGIGSV